MKHHVYRNGRVHVMREMCKTCVFRPGNLMRLRPGRVREMVDSAKRNESTIVCHSTLEDPQRHAACRGFYDRYPTQPLQIAQRLGLIEEDDHPEEEAVTERQQQMKTMLEQGVSVKEIAARLGITASAVYQAKGRLGMSKKRSERFVTPSERVLTGSDASHLANGRPDIIVEIEKLLPQIDAEIAEREKAVMEHEQALAILRPAREALTG